MATAPGMWPDVALVIGYRAGSSSGSSNGIQKMYALLGACYTC